MNKITILILICIIFSCDFEKKSNHKILEIISSIEAYLQVDNSQNSGIEERLKTIENVLKRQDFLEKFPVPLFIQDTVSVDSTFRIGWTMASFNPISPPIAIFYNNEVVDTITFSSEYGCFLVEIKEVNKGENNYKGEIYDNGRKFVIEGSFYGK